MTQPKFLPGHSHTDQRGKLQFLNDLDLTSVKRFYIVEHIENGAVRAWQGHQNEQKWFVCLDGEFRINIVQPDDWLHPSANLEVNKFILSSNTWGALHIPKGFASGIQSLTAHARLLIFSDATLQESISDDFRYDKTLWYEWKT